MCHGSFLPTIVPLVVYWSPRSQGFGEKKTGQERPLGSPVPDQPDSQRPSRLCSYPVAVLNACRLADMSRSRMVSSSMTGAISPPGFSFGTFMCCAAVWPGVYSGRCTASSW